MRKLIASTLTFFALLGGTAQASPVMFDGYQWNVFKGTGNLGQKWSADHVSVAGGVLTERITSDGVSGGVGMRQYQTYGTYRVRYRMSKGGGKYCILLFGKQAHNEIDFAEDKKEDTNRSIVTATLHYGASNNMIHVSRAGDFTQWHTLGVIWSPGKLVFIMDGNPWATITQHVPSSPMHMTIQTAAFKHPLAPSQLEVMNAHIG